jgi:GNAT superfamily N-acetyltransferase
VIEHLSGDALRQATADDPLVKASVLGGRMVGQAWSGHGAHAWQVLHRGEPSLTGIGSPAGAAQLIQAIEPDHPALRHASLPRGWLADVPAELLAERVSDWDWFWAQKAPSTDLDSPPARWLDPAEHDEVHKLLAEAMPEAAAWPGDARVRRWAGIRNDIGRLVACSADTARSPLIGHLSSVATAPDQRRKGYGAALIAWVTRQYFDEGADLVTLGMYADNVAGRRLYSQLGFTCEHQFTSAVVTPRRSAGVRRPNRPAS